MRTVAFYLALTGILLRGLIPVGDMLMFGNPGHPGITIAFCPNASVMSRDVTIDTDGHAHPGSGTVVPHQLCPFAVATAHGLASVIAVHFYPPSFVRPVNAREPVALRVVALRRPPVRGPPASLFVSI